MGGGKSPTGRAGARYGVEESSRSGLTFFLFINMVGDSLGLVLVLPVNKDARRAGEMDQIAFEIDVLRSGQKPFDMLHRILPSFLFRAHQAGGWDLVQRCFCWYRPDAPAE